MDIRKRHELAVVRSALHSEGIHFDDLTLGDPNKNEPDVIAVSEN